MIEQAVLGAMISEPHCIDDVLSKVQPEMFSHKARGVFTLIQENHIKGVPVDLVTLADSLKEPGISAYLAECTSIAPGSATVNHHCELLRDRWVLEEERHSIGRLQDATRENAKPDEFVKIHTEAIERIESNSGREYKTAKEATLETLVLMEALRDKKGEYLGIPCGITELDEITNGFQDEELIIVGARPSAGKTALGLRVVANAAKDGIPVGFLSLEMSQTSLIQRLASMESGIPLSEIRRPYKLLKAEERDVCQALESIGGWPLFIDDAPNNDLFSVLGTARRLRRIEGVRLLVVDYLSLIAVSGGEPRHEKVAFISSSLKALARDLKIPIIALSQLTRDAQGHRPHLANIRESGAIEQDADVVIFIHVDEENPFTRELIVAKQRNGPIGHVDVEWRGNTVSFVSGQKTEVV